MELSPRKKAVLAAIVRSYIETGEPIGSKNLMALLPNAPSSATLRNEMSELASLGLLAQPHTSAGRVPTGLAYRIYVQSLMSRAEIAESAKHYIGSALNANLCDPEKLPILAANALSQLTGLPVFSCYEVGGDVAIKRVQVIPASKRAVMIFVFTSDGRVRSRICRLTENVTPSLISRFEEIASKCLKRCYLENMTKAYLQNVVSLTGLDSLELMPLMTAVFEMADELAVSQVNISGTSSLYNIFGENTARKLTGIARRGEMFSEFLGNGLCEGDLIFLNDSHYNELKGVTMIAAKYKTGNKTVGKIGVIGKGRMSYDQIVPSIEYTAALLSKLMGEALKDMED